MLARQIKVTILAELIFIFTLKKVWSYRKNLSLDLNCFINLHSFLLLFWVTLVSRAAAAIRNITFIVHRCVIYNTSSDSKKSCAQKNEHYKARIISTQGVLHFITNP